MTISGIEEYDWKMDPESGWKNAPIIPYDDEIHEKCLFCLHRYMCKFYNDLTKLITYFIFHYRPEKHRGYTTKDLDRVKVIFGEECCHFKEEE